ncbi:MAG: lysophospholipid acyltransferase family protein [Acidimicrobiales bacterium]
MSETTPPSPRPMPLVEVHVPTVFERRVYAVMRAIVAFVNRRYWHTKVRYEAGLPSAPFILAPTHRSYIDTVLVGSVVPHYMHFMAKVELWKKPALAKILEILGAFPVDRDAADRSALESALKVLALGEPLVVYPEGERREGDVVTDIHEGVAYMALRSGVPVVPVAFYGSNKAWAKGAKLPSPAQVRAIVGPPMLPERFKREGARTTKTVSRRAVTEMTEALRVELQRLYDEAATMETR